MLPWAFLVMLLGLVVGLFGFTGMAGFTLEIAKVRTLHGCFFRVGGTFPHRIPRDLASQTRRWAASLTAWSQFRRNPGVRASGPTTKSRMTKMHIPPHVERVPFF